MNTLLSPYDASVILKINYRKILELIIRGKLPAIQIGRQYRIEETDLEAFIEDSKVKK